MDPRRIRRGLTRRQALAGAFFGAGAYALLGRAGPWARADGAPPAAAAGPARARSVIELWMSGGPSHVETFDPKPEAGRDIAGPLTSACASPVAGMRVGELLPLVAAEARRYALLRGMAHGVDAHETASYVAQTGRTPGADGLVYPCFGAVVSSFLGRDRGYRGRIPPYVVLTTPQGRFSEIGFLGLERRPFVTGGDPRQARFAVEGIVAAGLTDQRQRARRDLLHGLDTLGRALPSEPAFASLDACEEQAYDLILGDAGKVFDLSAEPDALRERYGRTTFGQSCLVARRLVEQGVPYVTVHFPGWDTHKRHFETMRTKLPELDRGLSTLLSDLAERGLLDRTLVWWSGEFGRTPRVQWEEPWNGGRGHHGRCYAALLAGGGVRGGQVVGASDARGETPLERPIHPRHLLRSMYGLLGIDPEGPLPNPKGLDVRVLPSAGAEDERSPLSGILP